MGGIIASLYEGDTESEIIPSLSLLFIHPSKLPQWRHGCMQSNSQMSEIYKSDLKMSEIYKSRPFDVGNVIVFVGFVITSGVITTLPLQYQIINDNHESSKFSVLTIHFNPKSHQRVDIGAQI